MKRGFTLIELIFVIIIIGILSAVLAPRFDRPTLRQAANQIVSHIRYTQHLAMVDNKFDPSEKFWYAKRWRIQFNKDPSFTDNKWAYTIFSGEKNSGILEKHLAKNIVNSNTQYLTGGINVIKYNKLNGDLNPKITKNMNLGHNYNVTDVKFTKGCKDTPLSLAFDYIGRPIIGNLDNLDSPYVSSGFSHTVLLLKSTCDIELINGDEDNITIRIEPETGYAHIL